MECNPDRIRKSEKTLVNTLNYTNVPVKINDYNKIEKQYKININVYGYENEQ